MMNRTFINLFYQKKIFLLSLFFLGISASLRSASINNETINSPIVNQVPQDETVDPSGTGMDLFIEWLDNHGNADVIPGEDCAPATWTDNRDEAMWNFSCGQFNGCIDITFTYTDACDNELTWTPTFCMEDLTPPVCGFPIDLTVDCSDAMSELILDAWLASEEPTDLSHPINVSNDYDLDVNGNCGVATLVTWTYTDACGNMSTRAASITIEDSTAPKLIAEATSVLYECDEDLNTAYSNWIASNGGAIAHDFCSEISWTNNSDGVPPTCNDFIYVLFTATDACGNSVSTVASFSNMDTTAPVLSGIPDHQIIECNEIVPPIAEVTVSDNCDDGIEVEFTTMAENNTITRYWLATDACGNNTSHSQLITFSQDITPPVLLDVPLDVTLDCNDDFPALPLVTGTDNCDEIIDVDFSENTMVNTIVQTWTATDNAGNTTTTSRNITILPDETAPILIGIPADITLDCNDDLPTIPVVIATDNCDEIVNLEYSENTTINIIVQTWTATDNAGNIATISRNITILPDETAPTLIGVPSDITLDCNDDLPAVSAVMATDNCDETIAVIFSENANTTTITQTWTATDNAGNESTSTRLITLLEDTTPPVLAGVPADVTLGCNELPEPPLTVTVTDDCDTDITFVFTEVNTPYFCGEIILRTWEATDASGNQVTAYQTINLFLDEQAPILTGVPLDISLDCIQDVPPPATVDVNDNCDETTLEFYETISGDDCLVSYVIERTWVATDACANMVQEVQKITVLDLFSEISILNPPTNDTLNCTENLPDPITIDATTTCEDGQFYADFFDELTAGSCPNNYTITRTWTVSDNCGTAEIFTQEFLYEDTIAPVFTYIPPSEFTSCTAYPDGFGEPEIEDNCGEITIEIIDGENAYNCDEQFEISRTWIATDACGNSSTAEQILTIWPDVLSPIFMFIPGDDVIQCPDEAELGEAIIVDTCLDFEVTIEDEVIEAGECPDGYTVRRTWTALNSCGYSETHSQTIEVLPAPMLEFRNVPENKIINCAEEIEFGMPICNSNCLAGYSLNYEDSVEENCADAIYTRTWIAIDACGNTATISQTIEVIDEMPPVFSTEFPDKTIGCTDVVLFQEPIITDLCGGFNLTFTDVEETVTCLGISSATTRFWTVIDNCGNSSSSAQTIFIEEDMEAPVFDLSPETISMSFTEYQAWEMPNPIATDNCGIPNQSGPTTTWKPDAVRYTWTATDACGNEASTYLKINFNEPIFETATDLNETWFTLSPNPSTDVISVQFISMESSKTTLVITDLYGRKWLTQQTNAIEGLNLITVDVADLPVGTYFLILKNKNKEQPRRFLKME